MEFLRIGENKIKIILTSRELSEYGITPGDDGCASATRQSVWRVLDRARAECGFDGSGDKLLIQFYPDRTGGCEMFVTKLGILSQGCARTVARSERVELISRRERSYLFYSLEELLCAARATCRFFGRDLPRSSLHTDGERYVLTVTEHPSGNESSELYFMREFSEPISEDTALYISEHFDSLYSDDAIERLLK